MPQDELANFGLSDEDIAERRFSRRFADFMEFQGQRAHGLYDEANYGISLLSPEGRLPVRVASSLYRAILDRLEAQSWNPFVGRARTNLAQKIALAFAAVKENYG
jgi:phytoene synthase